MQQQCFHIKNRYYIAQQNHKDYLLMILCCLRGLRIRMVFIRIRIRPFVKILSASDLREEKKPVLISLKKNRIRFRETTVSLPVFRFVESIWLHPKSRQIRKKFGKDLFYIIRAQNVLSYHPIQLPWNCPGI